MSITANPRIHIKLLWKPTYYNIVQEELLPITPGGAWGALSAHIPDNYCMSMIHFPAGAALCSRPD